MESFQLEPGLRIELVAAEPIVVDPVALAFDESGRIYVAENRGYPTGPSSGQSPAGKIALLEDRDGDGFFETRHEFAQNLTFPNGVLPWNGGVLVTCAPDLLFLKDSTGDGRADIRQVLFTGFDSGNTSQLRVSHPTFGPDNWIYLTSGLVGGNISSPQFPQRDPLTIRTDSRFHPLTMEFQAADGRAQFGMSFDDFGHRFFCHNRIHAQQVVLPSRYLRRNPHLAFSETVQELPAERLPEPLRGHGAAARVFPISENVTTADSHAGAFTAACGILVYRGRNLPGDYWNNIFVCEPAGNLVHRDRLLPNGAAFLAQRAAPGIEMVASTDNWFRPVNLAAGPDGALYICDMYRKTIEHPQYLPEEIRKRTEFDSGKGLGRIYRLRAAQPDPAGTASPPKKPAWFPQMETAAWVMQLGHPDAWWRETAQRLLFERQLTEAIPQLEAQFILRRNSLADTNVFFRLHALRTLEGLNGLNHELLDSALRDPHPALRREALLLIEQHLPSSPESLLAILQLAQDPDPRVRFQCALTLGALFPSESLPLSKIIERLVAISLQDSHDRWTRAAVLSSLPGRAFPFLKKWIGSISSGNDALPEGRLEFAFELGRLLGADPSLDPHFVLAEWLRSDSRSDRPWQSAGLNGFEEARRARGAGFSFQIMLEGSSGADVLRDRFDQLCAWALETVEDSNQSSALQLHAVDFLVHLPEDQISPVLLRLLLPNQPLALQLRAARLLARASPESTATLLARNRWDTYTPPLRESIISRLLSDPRQIPTLLQAIASQEIPPWSIPASRRRQLTEHQDETIRAQAASLLGAGAAGDRMRVYENLKEILNLEPDPANGKELFKLHCASCHRLDREGVAVGPDLFGIRNQPKEAILLHTLVPDYEIAPGFAAYEIETRDGGAYSGLITSETESGITLRQALGEDQIILRENILSLSASSTSLMPQEIEKNISRQDLADLISYLKGE